MSGEELNPQMTQISQMDADKLNPQIAQMNADDNAAILTAQPTDQEDESLIAGFGQLVRRVAHLETLLNDLLSGQHVTSTLSRPVGRPRSNPGTPAAGPAERRGLRREAERDGDFISPAAIPPAAIPPTAISLSSELNVEELPVPDTNTTCRDTQITLGPPATDSSASDPLSQVIDRAWRQAPLPLRLRFVRDLLPIEHPLQPVLKEAAGLEELRGHELETWLTGYPSLFADAVDRVETQPSCGNNMAEALATATLQEARQVFEVTIEAMGIEWIQPTPGAMIGEEHEVVGEAEAPVPTGRVASLQRRGFRRHGKLVLPAQILRALEGKQGEIAVRFGLSDNKVEASPTPEHLNTRTPEHPNTSYPDWLRTFQQRSVGCELAAVQQLLGGLRELAQTAAGYVVGEHSEADLAAHLEPLLPLLGARYVPGLLALPAEWDDVVTEMRDSLLVWLREALDIVVISPESGARCDAVTMQATGVRRTAHAHEDGTVAKVERIGLRRREQVLFRAQVLRYELGGGI